MPRFTGISHRYVVTLPSVADAPRDGWPVEIRDGLDSLAGVVMWTASDPSQAWQANGGPTVETRHRVLTIDTNVPTSTEADTLRTTIIDFLREVLKATDFDRLIFVRWAVEITDLNRGK